MKVDRTRPPEVCGSEICIYLAGDPSATWVGTYNRLAQAQGVAARAAGDIGPPSIRVPIPDPAPASADQIHGVVGPAVDLVHTVNTRWREDLAGAERVGRALSDWWNQTQHGF